MAMMPGKPNEPFFWGGGGQRMTPEDIARQKQFALQQRMAGADFSPVGHWTQGLARVAQGIMGGLAERKANRASEANQAESASVAQALLNGGDAPDRQTVLGALLNPNPDPTVRDTAGAMWQGMQPQEAPAPTEFARLLSERGIAQGSPEWNAAYDQYIAGKADPLITATLPGDRFYSGPQSQLSQFLQGQGGVAPVSSAPMAPVGKLTPIEPTTQNTPAPQLNAGGMPQALTRQQYQAVVNQMGQARTDDWLRRNNIQVGN